MKVEIFTQVERLSYLGWCVRCNGNFSRRSKLWFGCNAKGIR